MRRALRLVWCMSEMGNKKSLEEQKSELSLKIGVGASQWEREEEKDVTDREQHEKKKTVEKQDREFGGNYKVWGRE